jgi:putative addiction module antidote
MPAFKVTTVGASAGFILTKEATARLKVQKGDTVYLTEAPDGGYCLTPYNPEFERQMSLAEQIMHDDREVLRGAGQVSGWRWVGGDVVCAIHDRQLAEHGGLDGIRDAGAVESASARPRRQAVHGEPDAAHLAAP